MFWVGNEENSFPIRTLIWRPHNILVVFSHNVKHFLGAQKHFYPPTKIHIMATHKNCLIGGCSFEYPQHKFWLRRDYFGDTPSYCVRKLIWRKLLLTEKRLLG